MNTSNSIERLIPVNELEVLLADSQAGRNSLEDFLSVLASSELFIVSTREVPPGASGIHPMLFDRAGIPMAAVFTDVSRVGRHTKLVKSVVRMKGCELLKHIPAGYGVVINPGFDTGLELLPEGIGNVLKRHCG